MYILDTNVSLKSSPAEAHNINEYKDNDVSVGRNFGRGRSIYWLSFHQNYSHAWNSPSPFEPKTALSNLHKWDDQ